MSYIRMSKSPRRFSASGVVFSIWVLSGKNRTLRVGLSTDITKELGWKEGDRVDFLFGTGRDFPKIMLVRGSDTGLRYTNKRAAIPGHTPLNAHTTILPEVFNKLPTGTQPVDYTITADGLRVEIPPHIFKAMAVGTLVGEVHELTG